MEREPIPTTYEQHPLPFNRPVYPDTFIPDQIIQEISPADKRTIQAYDSETIRYQFKPGNPTEEGVYEDSQIPADERMPFDQEHYVKKYPPSFIEFLADTLSSQIEQGEPAPQIYTQAAAKFHLELNTVLRIHAFMGWDKRKHSQSTQSSLSTDDKLKYEPFFIQFRQMGLNNSEVANLLGISLPQLQRIIAISSCESASLKCNVNVEFFSMKHMTPALATFIGFWMADGTKTKTSIEITQKVVGRYEADNMPVTSQEKLMYTFHNLTGGSLRRFEINGDEYLQLSISRVEVVKFFETLITGDRSDVIPNPQTKNELKTFSVTIPDLFFEPQNEQFLSYVLLGLLDADGEVKKCDRVQWGTASIGLANNILDVLHSVRIHCNFQSRTTKNNTQYYEVNVGKENAWKLWLYLYPSMWNPAAPNEVCLERKKQRLQELMVTPGDLKAQLLKGPKRHHIPPYLKAMNPYWLLEYYNAPWITAPVARAKALNELSSTELTAKRLAISNNTPPLVQLSFV